MKLPSFVAVLTACRIPPSLGQLKYLLGRLRLAEAELAPFLRFAPARYCRNTVATGPGSRS